VAVGLIYVGYMTVKLGKLSLFGEHIYPLEARFMSVSVLRGGNHNALSLEENMERGRESIKGRMTRRQRLIPRESKGPG
jgi:hypothetical protein